MKCPMSWHNRRIPDACRFCANRGVDHVSDETTISLSLPEIANALSPYVNEPLAGAQLTKIAAYMKLLKKWNQTIPLTSLEEDSEIVARHFGESIFAGRFLAFESGRHADVGSGAGFPGLPLKIAFTALRVTLLEPNLKKCAFLREVREALALESVEVVRSTYEDFAAPPEPFDFICSRALGGYRRLLQWSRQALNPSGRVILWLGVDDSTSISRLEGWSWQLPVNIPESKRRVLLIGQPAS
jgi:16S rRNA (guanine527-N7)-methyltransferase